MQTFLPYPDFQDSFSCLDYRRLGKQRVECKQLLLGQFKNHPCAKMWREHQGALALYGLLCCHEWVSRGYKDTLTPWFRDQLEQHSDSMAMPAWLGDERVHSTHRANLVRKQPEHYNQFGWAESPIEGYFWPSK